MTIEVWTPFPSDKRRDKRLAHRKNRRTKWCGRVYVSCTNMRGKRRGQTYRFGLAKFFRDIFPKFDFPGIDRKSIISSTREAAAFARVYFERAQFLGVENGSELLVEIPVGGDS